MIDKNADNYCRIREDTLQNLNETSEEEVAQESVEVSGIEGNVNSIFGEIIQKAIIKTNVGSSRKHR